MLWLKVGELEGGFTTQLGKRQQLKLCIRHSLVIYWDRDIFPLWSCSLPSSAACYQFLGFPYQPETLLSTLVPNSVYFLTESHYSPTMVCVHTHIQMHNYSLGLILQSKYPSFHVKQRITYSKAPPFDSRKPSRMLPGSRISLPFSVTSFLVFVLFCLGDFWQKNIRNIIFTI